MGKGNNTQSYIVVLANTLLSCAVGINYHPKRLAEWLIIPMVKNLFGRNGHFLEFPLYLNMVITYWELIYDCGSHLWRPHSFFLHKWVLWKLNLKNYINPENPVSCVILLATVSTGKREPKSGFNQVQHNYQLFLAKQMKFSVCTMYRRLCDYVVPH